MGGTFKVWTANDTRNDWLLAKFWFRNADAQVTPVTTYFQEKEKRWNL